MLVFADNFMVNYNDTVFVNTVVGLIVRKAVSTALVHGIFRISNMYFFSMMLMVSFHLITISFGQTQGET